MNQTAFDFDAPAQRHSPTSVAAAEAIEPHSDTLRARVLEVIRLSADEGLTDEQIGERTGIGLNTVRPRRRECEKAGLIVKADFTRATNSGRAAQVWVAK